MPFELVRIHRSRKCWGSCPTQIVNRLYFRFFYFVRWGICPKVAAYRSLIDTEQGRHWRGAGGKICARCVGERSLGVMGAILGAPWAF